MTYTSIAGLVVFYLISLFIAYILGHSMGYDQCAGEKDKKELDSL